MTFAYRLSSRKWEAKSGKGAAIEGGRWNSIGVEVIYAASNPSLATLEILVHFSELPENYVLTEIVIPDTIAIEHVADELPVNWDAPAYSSEAQEFGNRWARELRSPVLSVPSSIMSPPSTERNFLINPLHPDFAIIEFLPSRPFRFDPRLK